MRVLNPFRKVGEFWLPGFEHQKVQGELKVGDGGGVEFVIYSPLGGRFNKGSSVGRVIGLVEDFGYVTLDGCYYLDKRGVIGEGKAKCRLGAKRLYAGVDLNDQPVFAKEYCFSVENLDSWVGMTGIRVEWADDDSNKFNVTYDPIEDIIFGLSDSMTLRISFSFISPGSFPLKEAKISQKIWLVIQSEIAVDVELLIEKAREITTFICLCLDQIVSIENVTISLGGVKRNLRDSIKVYYESRPFIERARDIDFHDPVFDFKSIQQGFELHLSNWSKCCKKIGPVIGLYFGVKMGTYQFLDAKFLALIQGLESLHRRTSDRKLMDEAEFLILKEKIIDGCPAEKKEWLSGRLSYANEISLAQRLEDLFAPFQEVFGDGKSVKKIIRSMVDTRNYYTHFDEGGKKSLAKGKDLVALVRKMELLLYLNFLVILGFDASHLRVLVSCHWSLYDRLMGRYESV